MRAIRNKDPKIFRLITIRTVEARLWLTPNAVTRKLIGGIIARYQEKFGIEIYAYKVLGNHIHMLIRAPQQNTDEFCENVNREIARRINWIHKRQGPLWSRRYTDQQVVSESDLKEAFLYVILNDVNHGLVQNPELWPGLNCVEHVLNERDRQFSFRHYSREEQPVTTHKLKISILPHFKHLSQKKRKKVISTLICNRAKEISKERDGKFLGLHKIKTQTPGSKPLNSKTSPCAPFYTKIFELIKEMRTKIRERREAYNKASFRYRAGEKDVVFPEYSYLPPLHRKPRYLPFCPVC